jgi:hypothetical protein
MKKILFILMFIVMIFSAVGLSSMPYGGVPLTTSANQYYSVVFDGEGEAIVTLRMDINNLDSKPISEFNMQLPGRITLLGVLQETTQSEYQTCEEWGTGCIEYGQGETCVQYDYNGNCAQYMEPCLRSGEICQRYITQYNYYPVYQRLDVEPVIMAQSVNLPIELVTDVPENGQTQLILVYKAEDFAKSSLGAYDFEFISANIPFMTEQIRVSIDVQEGLHLKGGQSDVKYLPNMDVFAGAAKMSVESSSQIRQYSDQIMYSGGLVKTSSYLDALETFSVKGTYSESWLRLYLGRVVLIGAAIAGILLFLWLGLRKLLKVAQESLPEKAVKRHDENKHYFIIPFMVGLLTNIGIFVLWVVAIFMVKLMDFSFSYGLGPLLSLLFVVIAIFMTIALMIGIPIYIGSRYGAMMGGLTVLSILGWLFILAILLVLATSIFTRQVVYY